MWYPMIIYPNELRYTWLYESLTSYHTNEANIDFFGEEQFDRMDVFSQYLQIAGTDLEGEMMRWSEDIDRKSTRLNSSHVAISYAVFCLKKKKKNETILSN